MNTTISRRSVQRLVVRTLALLLLMGCLPSGNLHAAGDRAESSGAIVRLQTNVPPQALPNGVAAGDVTQNGVVLWARSSEPGALIFTTPTGERVTTIVTDPTIPSKITVEGLAPNTEYSYSVGNGTGDSVVGHFKTPARVGQHVGLRFGVSGDWRGDLLVYPVVANAVENDLDFFVALGDTAYSDVPSPALADGSAHSVEEYRLKHDEVYSTRVGKNVLADLRGSTVIFATIDDHEVVDDFSGGSPAAWDSRFGETSGLVNDTQRYENGLRAFQEYNPIGVKSYGPMPNEERMDGEYKLYRYRTFGSDGALFLLDARSFRDPPVHAPTSTPEELELFLQQMYTPGRTMLGAPQLAELKRDLIDAEVKGITWKFVAVPEPIQNLGLLGRTDRFEGYAAERTDLLKFIHDHGITNVVFIAADIHGTVVNNLVYREQWESPLVHVDAFEVTTGPVAFTGTFGPAVAGTAKNWGVISPSQHSVYSALPIDSDMDSFPDDKDDYVKQLLNQSLAFTGDDPVGLADSSIDARLLEGDYVATHTNGWTQFEVDPIDRKLMVTTYGIPLYSAKDVGDRPDAITGMQPEIVSRFEVTPKPTMSERLYLPAALGK